MASRRSRQSTSDPPEDYQQSRAALRERYGTRAIDARAKQSPLDTTPSGRSTYLQQTRGLTSERAEEQQAQEFAGKFTPPVNQPGPVVAQPPQMGLISRQSRRQPFQGGLASPEDVGMVRQAGGTGTLQTPYGSVTLGLLPETAPIDQLSQFLPTTTSPLTGFALPTMKPTYLGSPLPSRFNRYG